MASKSSDSDIAELLNELEELKHKKACKEKKLMRLSLGQLKVVKRHEKVRGNEKVAVESPSVSNCHKIIDNKYNNGGMCDVPNECLSCGSINKIDFASELCFLCNTDVEKVNEQNDIIKHRIKGLSLDSAKSILIDDNKFEDNTKKRYSDEGCDVQNVSYKKSKISQNDQSNKYNLQPKKGSRLSRLSKSLKSNVGIENFVSAVVSKETIVNDETTNMHSKGIGENETFDSNPKMQIMDNTGEKFFIGKNVSAENKSHNIETICDQQKSVIEGKIISKVRHDIVQPEMITKSPLNHGLLENNTFQTEQITHPILLNSNCNELRNTPTVELSDLHCSTVKSDVNLSNLKIQDDDSLSIKMNTILNEIDPKDAEESSFCEFKNLKIKKFLGSKLSSVLDAYYGSPKRNVSDDEKCVKSPDTDNINDAESNITLFSKLQILQIDVGTLHNEECNVNENVETKNLPNASYKDKRMHKNEITMVDETQNLIPPLKMETVGIRYEDNSSCNNQNYDRIEIIQESHNIDLIHISKSADCGPILHATQNVEFAAFNISHIVDKCPIVKDHSSDLDMEIVDSESHSIREKRKITSSFSETIIIPKYSNSPKFSEDVIIENTESELESGSDNNESNENKKSETNNLEQQGQYNSEVICIPETEFFNYKNVAEYFSPKESNYDKITVDKSNSPLKVECNKTNESVILEYHKIAHSKSLVPEMTDANLNQSSQVEISIQETENEVNLHKSQFNSPDILDNNDIIDKTMERNSFHGIPRDMEVSETVGQISETNKLEAAELQQLHCSHMKDHTGDSGFKFLSCLDSKSKENINRLLLVVFRERNYVFIQYLKEIQTWRDESNNDWEVLFRHQFDMVSLDKMCLLSNEEDLILVMLLVKEEKYCLQFLHFENEEKIVNIEPTVCLPDSSMGQEVLLCELEGLKFVTAYGDDCFELSLHVFTNLQDNPSVISMSLESTPSSIHSLCKVDRFPNALVGFGKDVIHVWHLSKGTLVNSITLDCDESDPIGNVFWATMEKGMMFLLTTCEGASLSPCQMLAVNVATGLCYCVSSYSLPTTEDDHAHGNDNFVTASYKNPFLVAVQNGCGYLWCTQESDCTAILTDDKIEVTSLVIGKASNGSNIVAASLCCGHICIYELN